MRRCMLISRAGFFIFFFLKDPATTEIYTLSLHDALPISVERIRAAYATLPIGSPLAAGTLVGPRSEEHTSELQSRRELVCRLLLEKKQNYLGCSTAGQNNSAYTTYQ